MPSLFITAVLIGLSSVMLGIGGGSIIIPVLTLVFGFSIHVAIGTSVMAAMATSIMGSISYLRKGWTNVRLGVVMEVATAAGALNGAIIGVSLSKKTLSLIFAAVLVSIAITILLSSQQESEEQDASVSEEEIENGLCDTFYDEKREREVGYVIENLPKALAGFFCAGIFSGMFGQGCGPFKVPLLNETMNLPMKPAVATSNYMVGLTTTVAGFVYFLKGYVKPMMAATTVIGILTGSMAGTRLVGRVGGESLKKGFAAVVVFIAILMIIKVM